MATPTRNIRGRREIDSAFPVYRLSYGLRVTSYETRNCDKKEIQMDVYGELGVRRVVNAMGHMTLLGGSVLSPKVLEAMSEANRRYADMEELQRRAGEIISELTGAEAAYVTSGASAALSLGTAACMVGMDEAAIRRLPDTDGVKDEVIVQKVQRYKYDRCVTVPGARLVEVGDTSGATVEQVEGAIGPNTAAVLYMAPGGGPGVVPIEETIRTAGKHGVPVIVDAASQVYPVENLRKYTGMGADLICYGAKYFHAPNSTGLLVGRKDLVEAAAFQGFISFETNDAQSFARPMKVDRQEIVAVVVALREWVSMDHEARFEEYDRRARRLANDLAGIAGLHVAPLPEHLAAGVQMTLDESALRKDAAQIETELKDGDPSIYAHVQGATIFISTQTLVDGDEQIISDRLRSLLVD